MLGGVVVMGREDILTSARNALPVGHDALRLGDS
jgi:hypothetical protein